MNETHQRPTVQTSTGITDVNGILVGQAQDANALTGCTVILCPDGATGGIDRRGGATSTRQADGFESWHVVDRVDAILLTGGSAFGLSASSGVMTFLEEQNIGYGVGSMRVPIVGAAALYDLGIGDGRTRPTPDMAYQACRRAVSRRPSSGCVGAGMGATVGKMRGPEFAMKSGVGTASLQVGQTDLMIGAIVAVNAFGDIVNPSSGQILAGTRVSARHFAGSLQAMAQWAEAGYPRPPRGENTVIGVVATNAILSKSEAAWVAQMAQDGLARCVRPSHLMFDGDTIFTLATNQVESHVNVVGAFAAEAFTLAMLDAVQSANSMGGLPSASDLATLTD